MDNIINAIGNGIKVTLSPSTHPCLPGRGLEIMSSKDGCWAVVNVSIDCVLNDPSYLEKCVRRSVDMLNKKLSEQADIHEKTLSEIEKIRVNLKNRRK